MVEVDAMVIAGAFWTLGVVLEFGVGFLVNSGVLGHVCGLHW